VARWQKPALEGQVAGQRPPAPRLRGEPACSPGAELTWGGSLGAGCSSRMLRRCLANDGPAAAAAGWSGGPWAGESVRWIRSSVGRQGPAAPRLVGGGVRTDALIHTACQMQSPARFACNLGLVFTVSGVVSLFECSVGERQRLRPKSLTGRTGLEREGLWPCPRR